eukprot:1762577-Rhodomonas_salina.2
MSDHRSEPPISNQAPLQFVERKLTPITSERRVRRQEREGAPALCRRQARTRRSQGTGTRPACCCPTHQRQRLDDRHRITLPGILRPRTARKFAFTTALCSVKGHWDNSCAGM